MSPTGGAEHPGGVLGLGQGLGSGWGVPTLTLLNWEVEEFSLSVLFPAPRVFLSSAAGSGGAPSIRTPFFSPHVEHPNTVLGFGGCGGRRHPYPSPSPWKNQPKPEEGPRRLVLGAESCRHLSPETHLSFGCCKRVLMGAGEKGAGGFILLHQLWCTAPAPSPGATTPRRQAPIRVGPEPGAVWVPWGGGHSPPRAAQSSQRRGPMAGGDAVRPRWRGARGGSRTRFIARISRRSDVEEVVTARGSLAPDASSASPARWA